MNNDPEASAFLLNKRKLLIFEDINISILVEKKVGENKVPIPVVIEQTNKKSAGDITLEIENARKQELSEKEIVINRKTSISEAFYYLLPGFIRRSVWRIMLRNPRFVFKKMGNVAITSVGMIGRINGWFST